MSPTVNNFQHKSIEACTLNYSPKLAPIYGLGLDHIWASGARAQLSMLELSLTQLAGKSQRGVQGNYVPEKMEAY